MLLICLHYKEMLPNRKYAYTNIKCTPIFDDSADEFNFLITINLSPIRNIEQSRTDNRF